MGLASPSSPPGPEYSIVTERIPAFLQQRVQLPAPWDWSKTASFNRTGDVKPEDEKTAILDLKTRNGVEEDLVFDLRDASGS